MENKDRQKQKPTDWVFGQNDLISVKYKMSQLDLSHFVYSFIELSANLSTMTMDLVWLPGK